MVQYSLNCMSDECECESTVNSKIVILFYIPYGTCNWVPGTVPLPRIAYTYV